MIEEMRFNEKERLKEEGIMKISLLEPIGVSKEVLDELSKLITNMNLTNEQLDILLMQATAFAEYCNRNNFSAESEN